MTRLRYVLILLPVGFVEYIKIRVRVALYVPRINVVDIDHIMFVF